MIAKLNLGKKIEDAKMVRKILRKDLQELLMEFQEVFSWSYEDMPVIDLEIPQHHIDTHDHM